MERHWSSNTDVDLRACRMLLKSVIEGIIKDVVKPIAPTFFQENCSDELRVLLSKMIDQAEEILFLDSVSLRDYTNMNNFPSRLRPIFLDIVEDWSEAVGEVEEIKRLEGENKRRKLC